ncbi:phosphatidylinositol 4-phosphate 5-kinase 9-like [Asparagus officinalis]|uniref:phosphatidylinositol 4-phosphate 5-kinase 9-like n=1 Tax=Asparagus officinalis TaxID=4686 RepID=UPI00098E3A4A|nr:phosphatidylinositol 4-phosphate 5-kinase 9-like [Asparagus officinalis]
MAKDVKKPGETIIKSHRSYDLMLSLQLGIRYTVGKITPIQRRGVLASDFGPRASFWMDFPKAGSQLTPPHHSEDFKLKDYCPIVFRQIEIDSKFLETQHIMDYSLLLGVHYRAPQHLRTGVYISPSKPDSRGTFNPFRR